eukprot:Awhi_evm1s5018
MDLQTCLNNEQCREHFKNFLRKEASEENLLFWLAVENYREEVERIKKTLVIYSNMGTLKTAKVKNQSPLEAKKCLLPHVREIFETFLSYDSTYQINISERYTNEVLNIIHGQAVDDFTVPSFLDEPCKSNVVSPLELSTVLSNNDKIESIASIDSCDSMDDHWTERRRRKGQRLKSKLSKALSSSNINEMSKSCDVNKQNDIAEVNFDEDEKDDLLNAQESSTFTRCSKGKNKLSKAYSNNNIYDAINEQIENVNENVNQNQCPDINNNNNIDNSIDNNNNHNYNNSNDFSYVSKGNNSSSDDNDNNNDNNINDNNEDVNCDINKDMNCECYNGNRKGNNHEVINNSHSSGHDNARDDNNILKETECLTINDTQSDREVTNRAPVDFADTDNTMKLRHKRRLSWIPSAALQQNILDMVGLSENEHLSCDSSANDDSDFSFLGEAQTRKKKDRRRRKSLAFPSKTKMQDNDLQEISQFQPTPQQQPPMQKAPKNLPQQEKQTPSPIQDESNNIGNDTNNIDTNEKPSKRKLSYQSPARLPSTSTESRKTKPRSLSCSSSSKVSVISSKSSPSLVKLKETILPINSSSCDSLVLSSTSQISSQSSNASSYILHDARGISSAQFTAFQGIASTGGVQQPFVKSHASKSKSHSSAVHSSSASPQSSSKTKSKSKKRASSYSSPKSQEGSYTFSPEYFLQLKSFEDTTK